MKLHSELEVYVEIEGATVRAGTVRALFAGGRALASSQFTYGDQYVREYKLYALDPLLPVGQGAFYSGEDSVLFGAFHDLTPDDWGQQLIEADLAIARRSDSSIPNSVGVFDYLTLASDEARLGAIRFRAVGGDTWLGETPASLVSNDQIGDIAAAAARFEAHEATDEDLLLLGAPGTSAGGARPKVTAMLDGRLVMIKLPSTRDGRFDGEAWEYVAIALARAAGIQVQKGRLVPVGEGRSSLVLDRFDRGSAGERFSYMSARTAMELSDQTHSKATYEDLADAVDRYSSGDREQLRDLFKRIALTVLINNVDDHWKNHGFIRENGMWELSPAFDLNPSRNRGIVNSRPISSKDDPRNRDIRSLTETADVYALSNKQAAQALAEVLTAVRGWQEVAQSVGISDAQITSMSAAFSEEQQELAEREISRLIR